MRINEFVSLAPGTSINRDRLIAIIDISVRSEPLERYKKAMSDKGLLIDVCKGKRSRAMIVTDSIVFISSFKRENILRRLEKNDIR